MKFGKTLEEALTPEHEIHSHKWRAKFIDYKGLKKKIKVCAAIAKLNSNSPSPGGSTTPFPETPLVLQQHVIPLVPGSSAPSSPISSSAESALDSVTRVPEPSSKRDREITPGSAAEHRHSKALEIRMISYSSGRSHESDLVNDVAETLAEELRISGHQLDRSDSPDLLGDSPPMAASPKLTQRSPSMRRTASDRKLSYDSKPTSVDIDIGSESDEGFDIDDDEPDNEEEVYEKRDKEDDEEEDDDNNAEEENQESVGDVENALSRENSSTIPTPKRSSSFPIVSLSSGASTPIQESAATLDRLVVLHKQAKKDSAAAAVASAQHRSDSAPNSLFRDILKRRSETPKSPSAPLTVIVPPRSPVGSTPIIELQSPAAHSQSVEAVLIDVKAALSNPAISTKIQIPHSISNLNFLIPASITVEQAENMFIDALKREMTKINDFYHAQESKSLLRLDDLRQQAKEMRRLIKEGKTVDKAQTHQLRAAFQEFFRGVSLMKNFCLLNFTGFVKILKKYDKNTKRRLHDTFMDTVRQQLFVASPMLEKLETDTHSIFAKLFCHGDKRKAMDLLRVSVREKSVEEDVIYRSGLWLGACVPLVVFIMSEYFQYFANSSSLPSHVVISWNIYKLVILPILMLGCWALNILIWQRAHINFVFIFELNNRVHLHSYDYFELSARLLMLWLVSVFFYMETTISEMRGFSSMFVIGIPAYMHPFILLAALFCIIACPFNLFYKAARKWLLWELFKIFTAPLYAVRFADFFLADQLTSLGEFLFDFQFLICALNAGLKGQNAQSFCTTSGFAVAAPILTSLPFWARFWQCIRRYRDNGQVHPNLTNAGKYASHLIMLGFAFADSMLTPPGHFGGWKVLWLIANLTSTFYKGAWDFKMDWGLFEKGCKVPLLRKKRVFRQKAYYYAAMVNNTVLRLVWLALFIAKMGFNANTRRDWISFFVATLEIFRRFVWNIFRLEHEQVHNTESYRATADVPLPFTVGRSATHDNLAQDDNEASQSNLLAPQKRSLSRVLSPISNRIHKILDKAKSS